MYITRILHIDKRFVLSFHLPLFIKFQKGDFKFERRIKKWGRYNYRNIFVDYKMYFNENDMLGP